MTRLFSAALAAFIAIASTTNAGDRQFIGVGRLLTNDIIGDTHDRERTGSYALSLVWGPKWAGKLPERFGQVLEFRFNGEIMAPENLVKPAVGERPFAGALSFGLHTHFQVAETEFALGADLVVTGPQTGLDDFQKFVHDIVGGGQISPRTRKAQIGNDVKPTLVAEAGREIILSERVSLRPFSEGRWGAETLIRAGVDMTFGRKSRDALMVRAPVTGQRYRAAGNLLGGAAFVIGADVAYVEESDFLPQSRGLDLTDARTRVRAGVLWGGEGAASGFYGLTWLSKEFESQRNSQVVGSLRLKLNF